MKVVIALGCLVAVVNALLTGNSEWEKFKAEHGKVYKDSAEEHYRLGVFLSNKNLIDDHNKKYELGHVSYRLKMNQFGDMHLSEYRELVNGYKPGQKERDPSRLFVKPAGVKLADEVDWRGKGAVTPIKDQAQCGSCWAFSTKQRRPLVGSIEGQHFLKTGQLVSLSEQNLVDCTGSYGNYGCGGGLMDPSFQYVQDNGGIDTEESYPYEGFDGSCRFSADKVGATVSGYKDIRAGDEGDLKAAVATVGPISVAIDAGHSSFQFYSDGIYNEPDCSTSFLDHAVLAVGYGSENGHDYWLVKNSWGTSWGMEGYIKMARNKNNHCGIASEASYPLV